MAIPNIVAVVEEGVEISVVGGPVIVVDYY
jgi:hypothetical protein